MSNLNIVSGPGIEMATDAVNQKITTTVLDASETQKGVVRAATLAEVLNGTITNRFVQAKHITQLMSDAGLGSGESTISILAGCRKRIGFIPDQMTLSLAVE